MVLTHSSPPCELNMHCGPWLRLFCHIKLEAGEQMRRACDWHWKECLFAHTYTHPQPRTHNVLSLFSCELKLFVQFTEVLLHPPHPQSRRAPGELLRTTCWSGSSSGSGHVTGPARQTRTHQHVCKNKWTQKFKASEDTIHFSCLLLVNKTARVHVLPLKTHSRRQPHCD